MPLGIEIETKIGNREAADFYERIVRAQCRRVKPLRLLYDTGFKRRDNAITEATVPANTLRHDDLGILSYLGFDSITVGTELVIQGPAELPPRSVRVRDDDGTFRFAVKEPRAKHGRIDVRKEYEVEVENLDDVKVMLVSLGFSRSSYRGKYRVTFRHPNDALVEITLLHPSVGKPWIEIEAATETKVVEAVYELGFDENDMMAQSEAEYLRSLGVSEDLCYHNPLASGIDGVTMARFHGLPESLVTHVH